MPLFLQEVVNTVAGTTCQAAADIGRLYYGIDENPEYVAYAINRLKGVVADKDVKRRTVST